MSVLSTYFSVRSTSSSTLEFRNWDCQSVSGDNRRESLARVEVAVCFKRIRTLARVASTEKIDFTTVAIV
jgi:hypothetical protein